MCRNLVNLPVKIIASTSASFVRIVFELNNFSCQNCYDNDDDHKALIGVMNRP